MAEKAYIVEAVRTAGGKRDGKLSLWHPADLDQQDAKDLIYHPFSHLQFLLPQQYKLSLP